MKLFLHLPAAVIIFLCSLFSGYSLSVMPSFEKEDLRLSHHESLAAKSSQEHPKAV